MVNSLFIVYYIFKLKSTKNSLLNIKFFSCSILINNDIFTYVVALRTKKMYTF